MTLSILNRFLLRIRKSPPFAEKEAEQLSIIIQRPYAYLIKELQKVFKDQEDVIVKVDSRYGQRRTKKEPFSNDRRQADRRRTKEMLVEVTI